MKNLLLITIDCLRTDHITQDLTPNIYKLKEEGLSFEDVITHSSRTWIAFLSMFASVYFNNSPEKSLPGVLREHGYVTVGITQQPQMYYPKLSKVREDFEYMNSLTPYAINVMRKMRITGLAYKLRSQRYFRIYRLGQKVYKIFLRIKHFLTEKTIKKSSMTWMDAKNLNNCIYDLVNINKIKEPYFIWVHYLDPHWPYTPPKEYLKGNISEKEIYRLNQKYHEAPERVDKEELKKIKELYKGEVRNVDRRMAELLSFMKKRGLLDNAITIISADHAEEFFDHGRTQHSIQLYDEVVNVPFIIHGLEKKGEIKGQRGLINLSPTILDILGLPEEGAFQGRSMFKGADKEVVMRTGYGKLGIRTEEWKYISPDELYNLTGDPKEEKNVVKAHSNIVKKFEKKLEEYKREDLAVGETKSEMEEVELSEEEEALVKDRLKDLGYMD